MSTKHSHSERSEPTPCPHWTTELEELRARLRQVPRLLIMANFDGTLAPLVDRPEKAALHPDAPRVLKKLTALYPRVRLGILSGRALPDLASRIGSSLTRLILGGNHGLELSGAGLDWTHPASLAARPNLKELATRIKALISPVPGAELEDKGVSLTLHFRRVAAVRLPALHAALESLKVPEGLLRHEGKEVIEFRPEVEWHKGRALRRIMQRLGMPASTVIYLGSEVADEDPFRMLRSTGITVQIGPPADRSQARLQANDPGDAIKFLKALTDILTAS